MSPLRNAEFVLEPQMCPMRRLAAFAARKRRGRAGAHHGSPGRGPSPPL